MTSDGEPPTDVRQRAVRVFQGVYALAGEARDAALASACEDDAALRAVVEDMLRHHDAPPPRALRAIEQIVGTGGEGSRGGTPDKIGPYEIEGILGRGGMGVVYRATQRRPRRTVALKVLQPGLVREDTLKRFEREAEVLGLLQHPGIASIFDAGTCDFGYGALPYFAMELVEGEAITAFADSHELDARSRCALMVSVCDAVQHAHESGVIHRDLKPGNVLVTESKTGSGEPRPKVLDFGIARTTDSSLQISRMQTGTGQLLGTLPYMSPEQLAGGLGGLDASSDVYSLGVILYELLAGKLPLELEGRPLTEVGRIVRDQDPTLLGRLDRRYRGDLETIADKALAKEKERRYGTADELAEDLRRYLRNEPVSARPQTTWYQIKKFARRNRALVGGAIASLVILIGGLVATLIYAAEANALAVSESQARENADRTAAAHRLTAYQADMRLGGAALATPSSHGRVREIVKRWSQVPDGAVDLRGWEFDLLDAHTRILARFAFEGRYTRSLLHWHGPDRIGVSTRRFELRGKARVPIYEAGVADLVTGELRDVVAATRAIRGLAPGGELGYVMRKHECRIVRRANGELIARWPRDGHSFFRLQWTRDGKFVAMNVQPPRTAAADCVTVRRVADGEVVASYPVAFRADLPLAGFSADGRWLAVAECKDARGKVSLFSTTDWRRIRTFPLAGIATALRWQPGSAAFAVGDRAGQIRLYDTASGEQTRLDGHDHVVINMRWRADGEVLASSAKDGTLRLHVPATGISHWAASSPRGISDPRWSPDGRRIAYGGGVLTILDVGTPLAIRELVRPADRARGRSRLVWHPDGARIAVAFGAKTRLVDIATGKRGAEIDGTHVCFNRDASLAASRSGHVLRVHDMRDARILHRYDFSKFGLVEFAWHPTENRLGVATRRRLWVWTPGNGSPSAFPSRANMQSVYWRPSGRELGATHGAGIKVTDIETGGLRGLASPRSSFDAAWNPTGTTVAVAMQAQDVMLVTDAPRSRRHMYGHGGEVLCVAWSPDGARIATGSRDKTVRIWDPFAEKEVLTLEHEGVVTSVAWSPDGRVLASQTADGGVRLWDTSRAHHR